MARAMWERSAAGIRLQSCAKRDSSLVLRSFRTAKALLWHAGLMKSWARSLIRLGYHACTHTHTGLCWNSNAGGLVGEL